MTGLKPEQEEAITRIQNSEGNFIYILPTGFGKTRIFIEYAASLSGYAIIISPTLALMADITNRYPQEAEYIAGDQGAEKIRQIYQKFTHQPGPPSTGDLGGKYLLMSPERFCNPFTQALIDKNPPSVIIMDEAHCLSSWGPDFRSEFLLSAILCKEKKLRIIACSATLSKEMQVDVCNWLDIPEEKYITNLYNPLQLERQELSLNCFCFENSDENLKKNNLLKELKETEGSSLIFINSRKKTIKLAEYLNAQGLGEFQYFYGAGEQNNREKLPFLGLKQRNEILKGMKEGKLKGVVCTRAFGLGVDIPDVRLLVHYDVPPDMETYWQECSRAGRDGTNSRCVLFYHSKDHSFFKQGISRIYGKENEDKKIDEIVDFASHTKNTINNIVEEEYNIHHMALFWRLLKGNLKLKELKFSCQVENLQGEKSKSRNWFKEQNLSHLSSEEQLQILFSQYLREEVYVKELILKISLEADKEINLSEKTQLKTYIKNLKLSKLNALNTISDYAGSSTCRKLKVSTEFGFTEMKACGNCDNCRNCTQEYKPYRVSEKIHRTASGVYVRSKGEVIIADTLSYHGFIWEYEKPIIDKNGRIVLLPDFTIYKRKRILLGTSRSVERRKIPKRLGS